MGSRRIISKAVGSCLMPTCLMACDLASGTCTLAGITPPRAHVILWIWVYNSFGIQFWMRKSSFGYQSMTSSEREREAREKHESLVCRPLTELGPQTPEASPAISRCRQAFEYDPEASLCSNEHPQLHGFEIDRLK